MSRNFSLNAGFSHLPVYRTDLCSQCESEISQALQHSLLFLFFYFRDLASSFFSVNSLSILQSALIGRAQNEPRVTSQNESHTCFRNKLFIKNYLYNFMIINLKKLCVFMMEKCNLVIFLEKIINH